ncbi:hypothetical protein ACMXYN_05455 [Neptuniibacter sp. PT8_73]|uniref:hypothetical protein n=1 Tax=unclassified Neptuniibacter TaxID=2630693 RepID=UPI0039F715A4
MPIDSRSNFKSVAPFDNSKLAIMTPNQQQRLRDLQINVGQKLVIKNGLEIIASFSTNGWRHFRNADDVNNCCSLITDKELVEKLKEKYGNSLSIFEYPRNERPTLAEVYK